MKYLPEKYAKNVAFVKGLDRKINGIGKIDPKLIYLYLKTLGYQSTENVNYKNSKEAVFYNYCRNNCLSQREKWLNWDYHSDHSLPLRNKVSSLYPDFDEELSSDTVNLQHLQLDSNQIYYFAQLYYSDSVNQNMNPGVEYKKMYAQNLKTRISYYEKLFRNTSELSEDSLKSQYSQSLQYWYLFDNNYLAEYNISNPIPYNEILFNRYKQSYKEYYALSLGAMAFPLGTMFSHDIYGNYIQYNTLNPFSWKVKFENLFSAEIKFILPIKNEITFFSHLELGAGYLLSSTTNNKKTLYSYSGVGTGFYITKKCIIGDESNTKQHTFFAELSTPAFYFNRNIYCEIGGEVLFLSGIQKPG
jgi:hypothetical protein